MDMENKNIKQTAVGQIVADEFATAKVFRRYGIDFCCHGSTPLAEACAQAGIDVDTVIGELSKGAQTNGGGIPFASWPLDLLIDYVLKIHHRGIREKGPGLLSLIRKVREAHGTNHPELYEIDELMRFSLEDLENHLQKEENVLFPYLYELFEAAREGRGISPMHCGSIANPIRVMTQEHENEGERYLYIQRLTHDFQVPEDACASYRLMLEELAEFMNALFEHIHIENNILFPRFIKIEREVVR